MLRAFLKDSAIYTIPAIISRGISIFLVPLYTRVLSPADYGVLDLLIVFASLVNLTVALEVSQGVARFYTAEPDAAKKIQYVSTGLWFTIFCYSLFLGIAFLNASILSSLVMGKDGFEEIFQLGLIYIWLSGIFGFVQNQLRWELRSINYAVVSLLVAITTACFAVILAYFLNWGLAGILCGMIIGAASGCLYGFWCLKQSFEWTMKKSLLIEMLRYSAPLVPSGIAVFITLYIDRLMINHYLSLEDVGLFGIAFRVASLVGLVMVGVQGALTPLVFSHYQDSQTPKQLAAIFRYFIATALTIFLLLSLFAKEILYLMTTPAYYPAASIVIFLVPAILLSNMYIFAPGISIAKKTYLILYINVAAAILNVVLNWLLIPQFGITGAAVGTLISYTSVFASYMVLSQRFYAVPHEWQRIFFAVIVAGLVAFWIPKINVEWEFTLLIKLAALNLFVLFFVSVGLVKSVEIWQLRTLIMKRLF